MSMYGGEAASHTEATSTTHTELKPVDHESNNNTLQVRVNTLQVRAMQLFNTYIHRLFHAIAESL